MNFYKLFTDIMFLALIFFSLHFCSLAHSCIRYFFTLLCNIGTLDSLRHFHNCIKIITPDYLDYDFISNTKLIDYTVLYRHSFSRSMLCINLYYKLQGAHILIHYLIYCILQVLLSMAGLNCSLSKYVMSIL